MDFKKIISDNDLSDFPIGLGGCRVRETSFGSCDYDITVFDNSEKKDHVVDYGDDSIYIHHGKLDEKKSEILIHYIGMEIIQDESWDLRIFLSKIKEKQDKLFLDFAKNCLIDAIFCCQKTKDSILNSDNFAPCWQKCATCLLSDAISTLNNIVPSSHMLNSLRNLKKSSINENVSIINETTGVERATPSLLQRMLKSTKGFSDIVENNNYSKVIQKKYDYFLSNSMLSDCYFYLIYVNKKNFLKLRHSIHQNPDHIHILKVAFDIERDYNLLEQQAVQIQNTCNHIIELLRK